MTVAIIEADAQCLDAETGGAVFFANCPRCAGGLIFEAGSRGRADMVGPCLHVSVAVYCRNCKARDRIDVVYTLLNEKRTPERRYVS